MENIHVVENIADLDALGGHDTDILPDIGLADIDSIAQSLDDDPVLPDELNADDYMGIFDETESVEGGLVYDFSKGEDEQSDEVKDRLDPLTIQLDRIGGPIDDMPTNNDTSGNIEETNESEDAPKKPAATGSKKSKTIHYCHETKQSPDSKLVYFSIHIETTGPACNFDRIIEIGIVAYDETGTLLGEFDRRIGSTIAICENSNRIHGITDRDIKGLPYFDKVGKQMIHFMNHHLGEGNTGVLVAHSGNSVDFPYLCCELQHHGLQLPTEIQYTIDTLVGIKRFDKLEYYTASVADWPDRQEKSGKPSMSLGNVVNYLLRNPSRIELTGALDFGDGKSTFDEVCGPPHKAISDARGGAIVHMDKLGLRARRGNGLCRRYNDIASEMREKMKQPPLKHEEVAPPWEEFDDGQSPTITVKKPQFKPKEKPGPSHYLLHSIGIDELTQEEIQAMGIEILMVKIFFYYFCDVPRAYRKVHERLCNASGHRGYKCCYWEEKHPHAYDRRRETKITTKM